MIRCVVTHVLVFCVLVTQFATSARCHGGPTSGVRHDSRPHVHFNAVLPNHGHGRHHHHHGQGGGNQHKDSAPFDQTFERDPESPQTPDHDSDAYYFPSVDAGLSERTKLHDRFDSVLNWPLLVEITHDSIWSRPGLTVSVRGWPPTELFPSCPVYIRHLTLLI